jgi:hypothetical protein
VDRFLPARRSLPAVAAHFVLDAETGLVSYHITYERFLGEEVAAHLHPGLQAPARSAAGWRSK